MLGLNRQAPELASKSQSCPASGSKAACLGATLSSTNGPKPADWRRHHRVRHNASSGRTPMSMASSPLCSAQKACWSASGSSIELFRKIHHGQCRAIRWCVSARCSPRFAFLPLADRFQFTARFVEEDQRAHGEGFESPAKRTLNSMCPFGESPNQAMVQSQQTDSLARFTERPLSKANTSGLQWGHEREWSVETSLFESVASRQQCRFTEGRSNEREPERQTVSKAHGNGEMWVSRYRGKGGATAAFKVVTVFQVDLRRSTERWCNQHFAVGQLKQGINPFGDRPSS